MQLPADENLRSYIFTLIHSTYFGIYVLCLGYIIFVHKQNIIVNSLSICLFLSELILNTI